MEAEKQKVQLWQSPTIQSMISELQQQMPRFGRLLNVNPDELSILDYDSVEKDYSETIWRDKAIHVEGFLEGLPFISTDRLQSDDHHGYGITIYENRLNPEIKYILHCHKNNYGSATLMIVPTKNIFKLRRNMIRLNKEACKITNAPVLCAGVLDEVIQNTIGFLLKAKEIERYGVKIKRGIVLDGPPGNGKTMLCRYIQKLCTQNNIDWGVVSSADIDSAYEDKCLNDLFTAYTVTFFDDIDVAYLDRSKGNGKMACSLLTAMDGMSDKSHLVRIFTTNEPVQDLDAAFTRPGRIDKCITLPKPTKELRKKLVVDHWPKEIQENINLEELLNDSRDFSFAQLEAIRTFLVTNKILGDGTWDLQRAFEEYHGNKADKKKTGAVGFGAKS